MLTFRKKGKVGAAGKLSAKTEIELAQRGKVSKVKLRLPFLRSILLHSSARCNENFLAANPLSVHSITRRLDLDQVCTSQW